MGAELSVRDTLGNRYHCLAWFTATDGKVFCNELLDKTTFRLFERYFHLNLTPLLTVDEGMPSEVAYKYPNMEAYQRADVQRLEPVIECVQNLLQALQSEPDIFSKLEQARQEWEYVLLTKDAFEDGYFSVGYFQRDLEDFLQMLEYIKARGVQLISLKAA